MKIMKKILIILAFIILLVVLFYLIMIKRVHTTLLFWYIWPASLFVIPGIAIAILESIRSRGSFNGRKHEKDNPGFSLHGPDNGVCY